MSSCNTGVRTVLLDRFIQWSKKDYYIYSISQRLQPYLWHMPVKTHLVSGVVECTDVPPIKTELQNV